MNTIDIGISVSLQKLLDTRMLIQAGSGGGKSYALRKIMESVGNRIQQIILDPEGEFVTLREKFDFALIGKDGDIPLNLKYAETLAHKLLETNMSAIIDLYEFKHHERILFVKRFLEALVNAPKALWHSCLVYIDEAHIFCPESSKAESMGAVIDICTRGRKRGFAPILATQRLSKLHKDAAAECLNKLIGRTGLDIDRKRAGEELGFTARQDLISMRDLQPGEFHAFGPAIATEVVKFKVAPVVTTHPQAGKRITTAPPTPGAIKKIISNLKDLPEEAERELNTKQELQAEITRLRQQLARPSVPASAGNQDAGEASRLKAELKDKDLQIKSLAAQVNEYTRTLEKINTLSGKLVETKMEAAIRPEISIPALPVSKSPAKVSSPAGTQPAGGAMRMLKAAAMFHPKPITKTRMAALARLSHTSGSFSTYLSTLKREGLITGDGKEFVITDLGLGQAGDIEPLPSDPAQLIELWCDILGSGSGAARILRTVGQIYPEEISKEELGREVQMSHTSGSFSTYLSTLKRNGLIGVNRSRVKASSDLFLSK